jgi:acyl carrier protein
VGRCHPPSASGSLSPADRAPRAGPAACQRRCDPRRYTAELSALMEVRVSDRLLEVFSLGLSIPPDQLNDETNPDNTPEWDSLAAMELVTLLEESFDVRLKTSDIMKMRSIGIARAVLRDKGVPEI